MKKVVEWWNMGDVGDEPARDDLSSEATEDAVAGEGSAAPESEEDERGDPTVDFDQPRDPDTAETMIIVGEDLPPAYVARPDEPMDKAFAPPPDPPRASTRPASVTPPWTAPPPAHTATDVLLYGFSAVALSGLVWFLLWYSGGVGDDANAHASVATSPHHTQEVAQGPQTGAPQSGVAADRADAPSGHDTETPAGSAHSEATEPPPDGPPVTAGANDAVPQPGDANPAPEAADAVDTTGGNQEPDTEQPEVEQRAEVAPTLALEIPTLSRRAERMGLWPRRERARTLRTNARRHHGLRNYHSAERLWHTSMEFEPDHADASEGMARTLARLGRNQEAIAWAGRAIELAPQRGSAYEILGDMLLATEDREGAIAVYEECLTHDPRNRRVRRVLGRLTRQR